MNGYLYPLVSLSLIASAAHSEPTHHGTKHFEGVSSDGAKWAADVPENWNGTLLYHSRGGNPASKDPPVEAPKGSAPILLDHGYAIAGTTFNTAGWNPAGGAQVQFTALPFIVKAIGKPKHVINLATSYGGGVGAQEAERTRGEIDGAVLTCGLIVGGIDLMNEQLDGLHVIATLLSPGKPITLVNLRDAEGVKASAIALTAAVRAASLTPEGRARLALAAALMYIPTWHDGPKPDAGDTDAQAAQQAKWLGADPGPDVGSFGFIQGSRLDIETQSGGNPSWNLGVDYAALLKNNASRGLVEALYRKAGLSLTQDLAQLTKAADVQAQPKSVAWMRRTSVPSGALRVPVLAMQTSGDPVAPPESLSLYTARVSGQHKLALLRTTVVDRPGHCSFNPPEILAAADAMRARLDRGAWGALATPASLNKSAGPSAMFIADRHRPFTSRLKP